MSTDPTWWHITTNEYGVDITISSHECAHRYVLSQPYFLDLDVMHYACGHQAAIGAPCARWSCPIISVGDANE